MTITRKFLGQDVQIKLTKEEIAQIVHENQIKEDYNWVRTMMDENELSGDRKIASDIAALYRQKIEFGDDCGMGAAQHEIFNNIMSDYYDVGSNGWIYEKTDDEQEEDY